MNSVRLCAAKAVTNGVRQLRLDQVRTEAQAIMKHRPCADAREEMTACDIHGYSLVIVMSRLIIVLATIVHAAA